MQSLGIPFSIDLKLRYYSKTIDVLAVKFATDLFSMDKVSIKKKQNFWVYILLCDNGNYYTGYTNDIEKRYRTHLAGTGGKYTRSFKPICIVQCWKIKGNQSLAMKIENQIKKMPRCEKEKIIKNPALMMSDASISVYKKF